MESNENDQVTGEEWENPTTVRNGTGYTNEGKMEEIAFSPIDYGVPCGTTNYQLVIHATP